MNIETKIAKHLNVAETALEFDEVDYFAFSNSCTVRVSGVAFDVWFDDALDIVGSALAQ